MAIINGTTVGSLRFYADYSYAMNEANNSHTVTVALKIDHYALYSSALSGSYISVGGSKDNYSKTISYGGSALTTTTLATKSVVVKHDNNGDAKCNISGTFVMNGTYAGSYVGTLSVNQTITLPKIARASSISKFANTSGTTITSINTGAGFRVHWTPASTAFKYKVQCITPGYTYTSDFISPNTTGDTYATITTAHTWLPNQTSYRATVNLFTYNSSNVQVGATQTNYITLNVPASVVPSVSTLTAAVVDGKGGYYVQGKSKVTLTVAASGSGGSTIKSYAFNGTQLAITTTSNTTTSALLQYEGSGNYSVTVTDSRGRTASKSLASPITVYSYSAPSITSISVQRCNSSGVLDPNGTYAYVSVNSTYSPINGANTRTVVLTNSTNSTATTIQATTNTNGSWSGIYGGGVFAIGSTYTITATIKDTAYALSSAKSADLQSARRPINIKPNGQGAAFGKMAESDNLLDVAWNERIRGNLSVDGSHTVTGNTQLNGAVVASKTMEVGSATFGATTIKRNDNAQGAAIRFANTNGVLGFVGMTGTANGGLLRWNDASSASYTVLDTGNTKDYIVEQGTSGVWTYRKWNSGFAECYGYHTVSGLNINTAWGGWYASSAIIFPTFPFTFSGSPDVHISWESDFSAIVDGVGKRESTKAGQTYLYRPLAQTNVNGRFAIYAYGRWK